MWILYLLCANLPAKTILTMKVVGNSSLLRISSIRSEITSFPSQSDSRLIPTFLEQKRALNGCRYLDSCFWIVRPHFSFHRSTSYVFLPSPPPHSVVSEADATSGHQPNKDFAISKSCYGQSMAGAVFWVGYMLYKGSLQGANLYIATDIRWYKYQLYHNWVSTPNSWIFMLLP